jgi:hypothetical protein
MARRLTEVKNIKGWGADLPEENRPAVPKEAPSTVFTARGKEPKRQTARVKIHKSLEHPSLTPVFGTSCPPKGLSGLLRDFAYRRWSEGKIAHWMTLLLADRIDVVEGIFSDLARGKLVRPFKEMGLAAELKNRGRGRVKRQAFLAGVGVVALAGALWAVQSARRRKA